MVTIEIAARPREFAERVDGDGVRLSATCDERRLRTSWSLRHRDKWLVLREVLLHRRSAADPGIAVEGIAGFLVQPFRCDRAERAAVDLSVDRREHVTDDVRFHRVSSLRLCRSSG